jgi:hypothetical protein
VGENGAQPDWYLGWLIGALRMMPNWEPTIAGHTIVPNPFWGGAAFPLVVFGLLYAWPLLERRFSGDRALHHLLERPRDNPRRTAFGVALFTFTAVPFFAGAMDRVYLHFGIPYENAVHVMQWAWIVLPVITGYAALRVCRNLRDNELRPVRGVTARMVERMESGGFVSGETLLANPSWTPEAAEPDDSPPAGRAATLAQSAVERAQPELHRAQAVVRRTALSLAVLVVGTVAAAVAAAAAAVAIAAGLATVLPTWAAVLITVAVVLLVAGALVLIARRRRVARPPGRD